MIQKIVHLKVRRTINGRLYRLNQVLDLNLCTGVNHCDDCGNVFIFYMSKMCIFSINKQILFEISLSLIHY